GRAAHLPALGRPGSGHRRPRLRASRRHPAAQSRGAGGELPAGCARGGRGRAVDQRARADGGGEPADGPSSRERQPDRRRGGEAAARDRRRGPPRSAVGCGWEGGTGVSPPSPPAVDEFGAFLADVAVTVGRAVEAWRTRVAEEILRWEGEGYRTHRLEALLDQNSPAAVDEAIAAFVRDVERLKVLELEVAQLDPAVAGQSVFRDPERIRDAEEEAARARAGAAPPPAPSPAFPLSAYAVGPSNQVAV